MKKVTLLLVMLTMGITNAQTFDFSCTAPPIPPENPFTEAQADRLEAAGFLQAVRIAREDGVEFEQIFYLKNYDNNARTVYTITSYPLGYTVRYFDSRPENDYNTYSANTASGDVIITRMLRDQPQMENWINSDQRARLYNAGFRWDASIDPTTGQRFHFYGHWSGELWLRSNYSGNYQAFLEGGVSSNGNINTQIDKVITLSESVQTPYDAAITAFPGAVEATNNLYAAERPNPDTQPNRFRVFRKSDDYTVATIFVEDDARYHVHKANNDPYSPQIRFDTAQEALNGALNAHAQVNGWFEYASAEVVMMMNQGYEFNNSAWRNGSNSVQYLPVTTQWIVTRGNTNSTFDYSSVAVDYLLSGIVGELGFTGNERLELINAGWSWNNNRFNKQGPNQNLRIRYDGPGRYLIEVQRGAWGVYNPRSTAREAIDFANTVL